MGRIQPGVVPRLIESTLQHRADPCDDGSAHPENTPMANLLLTILNKAGIPQESVGDSTGMLSEV